MEQKIQHEQDYNKELCMDCPYCGSDRPGHSCHNCYSDTDKELCWKFKGYCSEKCLRYSREELPKLRQQKMDMGIKCKCDEPQCAKCLGVSCVENNCPTHTKESKLKFHSRNK